MTIIFVRQKFTWVVILFVILIVCNWMSSNICIADGEPTVEIVNSGMIIPINDDSIHIIDQLIEINLPERIKIDEFSWPSADISVRYEMENEGVSPCTISVAWPSGGISHNFRKPSEPEYPIHISLDGKPLSYTFLRRNDLAEPYIQEWLKQIDIKLAAKPKLKTKVMELRKKIPNYTSKTDVDSYISKCKPLSDHFGKWMVENGYLKSRYQWRSGEVAAGLLGVRSCNYSGTEEYVQEALSWLDSKRKWSYLNGELAERWGYSRLLLDPNTHYLRDAGHVGFLLQDPEFAVIRFDIKLKPKNQHVLKVNYKQSLGTVGRPLEYYGLVYFMEPARRWGRWDKTTIKITAPNIWDKVVVRPTPSSAVKTEKSRIMTIAMDGRPYENLYISLVPPSKKPK